MNAHDLQRTLAAADPLRGEGREVLRQLDLEAIEADLLADLEDGLAPLAESGPTPPRRRAPRLVLAGASLVLAAAIAVVIVLAGGGSSHSSRAYGAELVRFAESTPLLLLDGPGWRVQDVYETKTRGGTSGQMEFVTGTPVPWRSFRTTGKVVRGGYLVERPQLAAVRQRLVRLEWRDLGQESFAQVIARARGGVHPHGHFVRLPVLDTSAVVNTRAEAFVNEGGRGDREMVALWSEGDNLLTMSAAVPSLAAMEERLDWVTKVDSQTWLEAMPAKVVKAPDLDGTTREMLEGIPLPPTFAPSRIPNEGLTTSRNQVAGKVASTVACLWFRQWGEALRTGDTAARVEAEKAMATSRHWPILNPRTGEPPGIGSQIWQLADEMPQGYWDFRGHHRDLLAHAESLGCARLGLPLLPEKMQRQRQHGVPPPPG